MITNSNSKLHVALLFFLLALMNVFPLTTPLPITTSSQPQPPPSPQIEITLGITRVELRTPFTVSCSISHLTQETRSRNSYFVRFFSSGNGLLASYNEQVTTNNLSQPLLIAELHSDVHVTLGSNTEYPLFELTVEELVNAEQHYWCSLEVEYPKDGSNHSSTIYKSAVWEHISLEFSKLPDNKNGSNAFQGRCTLRHFSPANLTYNVQFHMYALGHLQLLVANYSVVGGGGAGKSGTTTQNQRPEVLYVHSTSPYWSSVVPGASRTFPHFDIAVLPPANTASTAAHEEVEKRWWCEVGVGVDGRTGYELFRSNVLTEKKVPVSATTTTKKH